LTTFSINAVSLMIATVMEIRGIFGRGGRDEVNLLDALDWATTRSDCCTLGHESGLFPSANSQPKKWKVCYWNENLVRTAQCRVQSAELARRFVTRIRIMSTFVSVSKAFQGH
jgi:hypothetical protein